MTAPTWHEGCPTCGALRHIEADHDAWLVVAHCSCGEAAEYVDKARERAALQREINR